MCELLPLNRTLGQEFRLIAKDRRDGGATPNLPLQLRRCPEEHQRSSGAARL